MGDNQEEQDSKPSPEGRVFQIQVIKAPAGTLIPRCNTKAKLEARKLDMQGVMLRLPLALRKRIEEQTAGSLSVTICALVEYAMDQLEQEEKAIVVTNR